MERPRVVYDTNVVVPALIGYGRTRPSASASVTCLLAVVRRVVTLVASEPMLDEVVEVLQRHPWTLSLRQARWNADFLRRRALVVDLPGRLTVLQRDPDDNQVLETALVSKVTYLVTNNIADFAELDPEHPIRPRYRGITVLQTGAFLQELRAIGRDVQAKLRPR